MPAFCGERGLVLYIYYDAVLAFWGLLIALSFSLCACWGVGGENSITVGQKNIKKIKYRYKYYSHQIFFVGNIGVYEALYIQNLKKKKNIVHDPPDIRSE